MRYLGSGEGAELLICGFEEYQMAGEYRHRIINHDSFVLLHVLEADGVFSCPGFPQAKLLPGHTIQRYPGADHEFTLKAGSRFLGCYIKLPDTLFKLLSLAGEIGTQGSALLPRTDSAAIANLAENLIKDIHANQPNGQVLLQIQTLALRLLQAREMAEVGLGLEAARERLRQDFRTNLPALAGEAGCGGYSKFRRDFRLRFGISPGEFRIRCRIAQAQELLAKPGIAIKEVARKLGYPDAPTFARQFRRVSGLTPGEFRQLGQLRT